MNGPLGSFIKQHLELGKYLGLVLYNAELALNQFDRYLAREFPDAQTVTRTMVVRYLRTLRHLHATTLHDRLSYLRQFCRFLFQRDPKTYLPERGLVPPRRTERKAHVYTEKEARALIRAALDLPPSGSLRPHTYATLLLSCGSRASGSARQCR